jgi:DNA-binding PadR family transcriptional regulator
MRQHTKDWITWGVRERGFGFPPGFPFGGWGGPGHRQRGHERSHPHGHRSGHRGRRRINVRATVLALLTERPMHGYEMIQELDSRTGGIWRPSPGSIYPTLQLLEDEGLIVAEESGGRKRFTLTEAGQAEAQEAAASPPWNEFGDETVSQAQDFRDAAFGIMDALRQVGFNGTDEQRERALAVLTETRRKLYAILAEDAS